MPYRFIEEMATADIAFEASGRDLEETFISAAEATLNVMIENPASIESRREKSLRLQNEELDLLLFDFLQEIIFYKDAEQLLLRPREVRIRREGTCFRLQASLSGEKLQAERHQQRVDVKAVTLHQFSLRQTSSGWRARLILDI